MRMLEVEKESSVRKLQLYLSPKEAMEFRKEIDRLLADPEANEHSHVFSADKHCELSFSIVTEKKLNNVQSYTKLEQKILSEK